MTSVRMLLAVWLIVASIVCCFLAFGQKVPVRRRQLWLVATAYFGLFFVVVGVANFLRDKSHSPFEADGVIVVATVDSDGMTQIQVRMAGGGVAHVYADGESQFFRVGEHVKVKYVAYTGSILEAQFFAADGKPEGEFHHSEIEFPAVMVGIGLLVIGFGWLNFWRIRRRELRASFSAPDAPSFRA